MAALQCGSQLLMAVGVAVVALTTYLCSPAWPLGSDTLKPQPLSPSSSSSSSSSMRWLAFPAPLLHGGFDPWSAVVEIRDASFTRGRLHLHGLSADAEREALEHLQPYRHHEEGIGFRFDDLDSAVAFHTAPLNLSSCTSHQPRTAVLLSPYLPHCHSHWVMDTLVATFAVLHLAHALPGSAPQPPVLYAMQRYTRLPVWEKGVEGMAELLPAMFDGDVRGFAELQGEGVVCFERLLWGRGPLLHRLPSLRALEAGERENGEWQLDHSHLPLHQPPTSASAFATLVASHPAQARLLSARPWRDTALAFSRWVSRLHGRPPTPSQSRSCGQDEGRLRVLFIVRPRVPRGGRFVSDVELLQAAFAAHASRVSFSLCCDWSRSLREQLSHFEAADVMVGLHGAGLLNALWMPAGGRVVELAGQHGYGIPWYDLISERAGHRYTQLDARPLYRGDELGHVLNAEFVQLIVHTVLDDAESCSSSA